MPARSKPATRRRKAAKKKPAKPYPGFPLFPHATGRWAKKIRGKFVYFGPWSDPDAALQKYLDQRDDLHAGRTPRPTGLDGLTVRDLINQFLNSRRALVVTGEIKDRTFAEYHRTCSKVIDVLGRHRLVEDLAAQDFDALRQRLSQGRGPVSLGNDIQKTKTVFKYAYDQGLIQSPVRYGTSFQKPSKKVIRLARAANGNRMFEPAELRAILAAADQPLKAMVLLAANCAFGQSDIANLPKSALNLDVGWVDFPRPKTGIPRRVPLWPETVEAVREAMDARPEPLDAADAGMVFLTPFGRRWVRPRESDDEAKRGLPLDAIGLKFLRLLKRLKLKRSRVAFYAIRHGFQTVAGESLDQVAVNAIMGHADSSMAAAYRERIGDDRILAVTNHVRRWLFGDDVGDEPIELGHDTE